MTNLLTISIPEAGRRLGIGRDLAYEMARQGKIPIIQFGRLKRVPVKALEQMMLGPFQSAGDAQLPDDWREIMSADTARYPS